MQMRIKTLFKDNIIYIAICISVAIGYLSLIQLDHQPMSISHLDKIQHAFAYCVLATSWLLSFSKSITNKKLKYTIAIGCVFYGIIIEVLQTTLTTYRTASFLDILANTLGVFVALLIFDSIYKKIHAI